MLRRSLTGVALAGSLLALAAPVATLAGAGGATAASAELRGLDGMVVGWARLTEDATGTVHVNVHVDGLTTGLHGIHIHAVGACTAPFSTAGGHHNPLGLTHGSHAGDLQNLTVNVAGRGHLDGTTDAATLTAGSLSVFDANGSAVVIHAGTDDYVTDPAGNSGVRIACGVIVAD